jgi:hypothetical protein
MDGHWLMHMYVVEERKGIIGTAKQSSSKNIKIGMIWKIALDIC